MSYNEVKDLLDGRIFDYVHSHNYDGLFLQRLCLCMQIMVAEQIGIQK